MKHPLRLRLDPVRCDGHGHCADLLPELITLDEWGYPIVDESAVADSLRTDARRAVNTCPVLALRLTAKEGTPR